MAHGVDASAEGNGGALVARLAEVWADRDAERMAELDRKIAAGEGEVGKGHRLCPCGCLEPAGHCAEEALDRLELEDLRPSGGKPPKPAPPPPASVEQHLVDLERKRDEQARVLLGPLQTPATTPAAAAPPSTTEEAMPCSKCKKPGHNARGCPESKSPKAAPAPAREEARPRPPRRGRVGAGVLDQVDELRDRARTRLEEIAAEVDELEASVTLLRDEARQLREFLGNERQDEPVAAVG